MLERIALHQSRLRTPGLTVDARGVALGAKGLLLLPSLDRLVGFLALYTRTASLSDLLGSLEIRVLTSKLGGKELAMTFAADSSDRMDRIAELARLAGGFTFTGSSRHFVQYRDAAAPFGYDVAQISPTDAPIALYHDTFQQHYTPERSLDLARLVMRLQPRVAPSTVTETGPRWICAEPGPGAALIHYFVRSQVAANVGIAEWPPASGFDETPVRRHLFHLEALPERMLPLLRNTPGVWVFVPQGRGAAVELGHEHPINLRGCPVFPPDGLVLLRGAGEAPLRVEKLPALGPVAAFAKVHLHDDRPVPAGRPAQAPSVSVPLKLSPDTGPWRNVTASLVLPHELGLLRQLAYRLGRSALEKTRIAFTDQGAFLMRRRGIEGVPLGEYFRPYHPRIMVAAGTTPIPAVAPEVLYKALGSPADQLIFVRRDGTRIGVPEAAFVALEDALLDAQTWRGTTTEQVTTALSAPLPVVALEDPGFRPMRDVTPPSENS